MAGCRKRSDIMRELNYQLVMEDYKSWLHWNVVRNQKSKMKTIASIAYVVFVIFITIRNFKATGGNIMAIVPSIVIAVLMGVLLFYGTSVSYQEKMLFKRSGLKNMEKSGQFPTIHIELKDTSMEVTATNAKETAKNEFSYRDFVSVQEIDRLYLLEMGNRTWQFIALSAFADEEEKAAFRSFMEEKIADAKVNPAKYALVKKAGEDADESAPDGSETAGGSLTSGADGSGESDEADDVPRIQPVDTSRMGKIGKMAHIMAAMDREKADADGGIDGEEAGGGSGSETDEEANGETGGEKTEGSDEKYH